LPRKALRLLSLLSLAIVILTTAVQTYDYATGRSPTWLPHPSILISLAGIFCMYALAAKKLKS